MLGYRARFKGKKDGGVGYLKTRIFESDFGALTAAHSQSTGITPKSRSKESVTVLRPILKWQPNVPLAPRVSFSARVRIPREAWFSRQRI